jgi:hypothetical protein
MVTGGVSPNAQGKLGLGDGELAFRDSAEKHRVITSAVHGQVARSSYSFCMLVGIPNRLIWSRHRRYGRRSTSSNRVR